MSKNAKKFLLANLENFSPKVKSAVKLILDDLQKAEDKIAEFEAANKKICKDNSRVEIIDERHCKFNGEIFTRNKANGYYEIRKTLHNAVFQFYNGIEEIPKGYLVHHNGTDEDGNFDKEKNDIEYLILMKRGEHTKLHSPLTINKKKKFVCKVCGKIFEANNHGTNCYCSRECINISQRKYLHKYDEEKICEWCGEKFFSPKHREVKFCSAKCASFFNATKRGLNLRETVECKYCKKIFKQTYKDQKYCSKECFNKMLDEKRKQKIRNCEYCHKEFIPKNGKKSRFCSKSCGLRARYSKNKIAE